jgi:hypothetical protein
MKKLIILGLAIILFACEKKEAPRFMTSSPDIDVLKSLIKDYEEGNWATWATHYAPNAEIYQNSLEPISSGELQNNLTAVINNLSSYKFSHKEGEIFFENIIDDKGDNWVYFWGTWKGTVSGTNKELLLPIHIAFEMVDNKIVKEYAYYDPSSINNAIIEKQVAEELVE